ncbi:beta lactamase-like protein, putative [Bodo saltans]|uniref:ribonuclease Z n=1 Tax=Bodo saltans TaxID=75058 RepID=A0A0S4JCX4_BODSA|nr:beta lactamase-like protein, putative [Bodo saltans]|eukprot:CUG86794.1 beta lactamase-like protein, putative [Bodo saltans]
MSEGRLRIGKVSTFLFTRVEISSVMGLPGFLFSVNDCGLRRCHVGGPLDELLAVLETTWRCFFGFRSLTCELPNYSDPLSSTAALAPVRLEGGFKLAASKAPVATDGDSPSPTTTPPAVVHNLACRPSEWYNTPGKLLFRTCAGVVDVIAFYVGMSTAASLRASPTPIVGYVLLEREKVVFDAAAAKAMGVKPGPKFAKLKAGLDVESDVDPSVTVKAADVTRAQPGSVFSLVLDTDNAAMLQAAIHNLLLLSIFNPAAAQSKPPTLQYVFHLATPATTSCSVYQSTIANSAWWATHYPSFVPNAGAHLEHANTSMHRGFTGFPTALVHRMHLNALAPAFFPFPAAQTPAPTSSAELQAVMWPYASRFRLGATAKKPPGSPLPPDELVVRYPDAAVATAMLSETFRSEYLTAHGPGVPPHKRSECERGEYGDITFLGTGSSIPSKYRNVSGIIVKLPSSRSDTALSSLTVGDTRVVLDCGEGTVGQLFSLCAYPAAMLGSNTSFSVESTTNFDTIMSTIEVIFISHSHADHNLGLFSMIEHMVAARRRLRESAPQVPGRPLVIIAPADFLEFVDRVGLIDLSRLQREEQLQLDAFSSNGPMLSKCPVRGGSASPCPHQDASIASPPPPPSPSPLTGLSSWCSLRGYASDVFPVDHPAHAHGIVLQKLRASNDEPFAVLYSGDTRPNELLIQRGRQFGPLDVLIHEATFDDSLAAEAKYKNHSTTGEAIEVARRCHAKTVLLTHFSQRYPKLPPPSASANQSPIAANCSSEPRVVFAFDSMRIPIQATQLGQLAGLTPAFVALLAEYDSWESGTSKRLREDA